jgi:hypothetical protein
MSGHLFDPLPPANPGHVAPVTFGFVDAHGERLADEPEHLARNGRLALNPEYSPDCAHDPCHCPGGSESDRLLATVDTAGGEQSANHASQRGVLPLSQIAYRQSYCQTLRAGSFVTPAIVMAVT